MNDEIIYTETIKVTDLLSNSSSDDFTLDISYTKMPKLQLPFINYHNDDFQIYYISSPLLSVNNIECLNNLNNSNFTKIGLSIYQEFPSIIKNKYESEFHKLNPIDYQDGALLWIHPFKNPHKFNLIDDTKNFFFNYSNFFLDTSINKSNKDIDIIIICDNFFNVK